MHIHVQQQSATVSAGHSQMLPRLGIGIGLGIELPSVSLGLAFKSRRLKQVLSTGRNGGKKNRNCGPSKWRVLNYRGVAVKLRLITGMQYLLWLGSLTVTWLTCNPEVTQGRRFDSAPGHCRASCSHTCASVTKQYNLVPVKGR